MAQEYTFEDGINQAVRILKGVQSRPLAVAIFSSDYSNVSFALTLRDAFDGVIKPENLIQRDFEGELSTLKKENPDLTKLEGLVILVSHSDLGISRSENPVILAKNLGINIALKIGVYTDPRSKLNGNYDLVVRDDSVLEDSVYPRFNEFDVLPNL